MKDIDVLISGAGPSGLMMGCQLALHNIPFRIIDKNEDHTTQSRALVVQARSVEIFDQMGIAEKAIEQGKVAKAIGAFFNGKKAFRITVSDMGEGLTKFPFLLMLEQSHTEKILVDYLAERGYEVERKTELLSFTQNNDEVTCTLQLADGNKETVNAKYVIGADGSHSVVREQLKIPFVGSTYEESLFVLDCKAEVDLPNDEMYLTFSDVAIGGFFPLTNGRWRILGNIPKELEGKHELTFEDINKNFAQRTRMKVKLYDPQWISAYRSHHRYAASFRQGRCFLIGDAAHIHSPVGAQGMNTGLQDAYNLAWKLALVHGRKAKETLLDTYTAERIIIAKNLVRTTDRAFNIATSGGIIKTFRLVVMPVALRIIAPIFEGVKSIRQLAFKLISEIGINYRRSILSQDATLGNFSDHAPKPGDRLPFITFIDSNGNETNIHENLKGSMFHLFQFIKSASMQPIADIANEWSGIISIETIPFNSNTRKLFQALGINNSGCYLIRPDGYIGYRTTKPNAVHFKSYLDRFFQS